MMIELTKNCVNKNMSQKVKDQISCIIFSNHFVLVRVEVNPGDSGCKAGIHHTWGTNTSQGIVDRYT